MMKVALVKTTVDNGTIVKEEVIGSQDVDLIETSTIVSKKQFKDVGMKVSVKSVPRPIPYNKRKSRFKFVVGGCIWNCFAGQELH